MGAYGRDKTTDGLHNVSQNINFSQINENNYFICNQDQNRPSSESRGNLYKELQSIADKFKTRK